MKLLQLISVFLVIFAMNTSCDKGSAEAVAVPAVENTLAANEMPETQSAISLPEKPKLRLLESTQTKMQDGTPLFILRDPERIAKQQIVLTPLGALIASLMDGTFTAKDIADKITQATSAPIKPETVNQLTKELDDNLMLDDEHFKNERERIIKEFTEGPVRSPFFAGSAYPAEKDKLVEFLKNSLEKATPAKAYAKNKNTLTALIAPHIDPTAGAKVYGSAYGFLAEHLPKQPILFIVIGTAHAGVSTPMVPLDKDYDTPLGKVETDHNAIKVLKDTLGDKFFAEALYHRSEHSVEFQMVWLKYIMGERTDYTAVPILASAPSAKLQSKEDKQEDAEWDNAANALKTLKDTYEKEGKAVIFVLGIDFAHIGLRFGDDEFKKEGLAPLEKQDRTYIEKAVLSSDEAAIINDIKADYLHRKYCGIGPLYLLAKTLGVSSGSLLDYGADLSDGAVVSFAAVALYEKAKK